jgi:hypothetical protein
MQNVYFSHTLSLLLYFSVTVVMMRYERSLYYTRVVHQNYYN